MNAARFECFELCWHSTVIHPFSTVLQLLKLQIFQILRRSHLPLQGVEAPSSGEMSSRIRRSGGEVNDADTLGGSRGSSPEPLICALAHDEESG